MELKLTPNATLKPTMPPGPVEGYVGSDILLDLVGIPAEIGNCTITAVRVSAHFADESATTVACGREADGTWSCTIPGNATSGRVENGVQILVDGTTTSGATVTGSVLAICDLAIYTRDMTIDAGETVWYLHYFDTAPATPKKGDVAPVDGTIKLYNGTEWVTLGGVTPDDAVTRTSANGVKASGIWAAIWGALTALPTGFSSLYDWVVSQLAGKANDSNVVHNTGNETISGNKIFEATTEFDQDVLVASGSLVVGTVGVDSANFYNVGIRTYGHSAPIQYPEYEGLGSDFFALIQHIAPNYDDETSHTYAVGELRAYQGAVYRCVTAHTATAWVAANWTSATVEDVLATIRTGKQDALSSQQLANIEAVPGKAPLDSPAFTGTPTAPTAAAGTNTAQVATTAFVAGSLPYALVTAMQTGDWQFSGDGVQSGSTYTIEETEGPDYTQYTLKKDGVFLSNKYENEHVSTVDYSEDSEPTIDITATRAWALQDRAGNTVTMASSATLQLPPPVAGKARDFLVRLEISGSTVPTITFAAPTGETITYETDGDEFPVPDEEGTWLYSFTESCVAHTFAVALKKVNTVAQGGS